jgi:protein SCO1/2
MNDGAPIATTDTEAAKPTEPSGTWQRLAGSPWFWVALVLVVFAVPLVRTFRRAHAHPVGVLWPLPDWTLTDQNGQPYGARNLHGKVYIANFIFTSCALECPRLTREMGHLVPQLSRFGDRVHFVSISVDPTTDTPERLRTYMARYHADPQRWTFVTGPEDAVMQAVTAGFRVGVEQPPRAADGTFNPLDLAHSNRFALVDAQGQLRNTYEADPAGVQQLLEDVATVVAEP